MAVTEEGWPVFAHVLGYVRDQLIATRRPIKVLSLGYTDFVISRATIAKKFGNAVADAVRMRPDSKAIASWHGRNADVLDTESFYAALGFQTDFLDIAQIRGCEIVHDLNTPIPQHMVGAYDYVIDSGTLEHCFNVAQAIANVATALRVNGFVHHGNPMIMINHGFYNFSPAFYFDFYRVNGFEVRDIFTALAVPEGWRLDTLDGVNRVKFPDGQERTIQVVARKLADTPIKWPMQSKYVANPNLRAE
jgi:hypothetical protein